MQNEQTDQQVETKVQQDTTDNQQNVSVDLSVDELKAELEKLQGYNDKLRKEAEGYRKKNTEYRTTLEEREKRDMEEKGMYKEMWEKEKAEKEQLFSAARETARRSALNEALTKEGCNPKYVNILAKEVDLEGIDLDDRYKANSEQVEFQVSRLKNEYIDLFKKDISIKDGTPTETRNLSYNEELKACKTQADLEKVMKKHGRI